MEKVNVAFLSEDREKVVESLQEHGIVEIKDMPFKRDFLKSVNINIDNLSSLFLRYEKIYNDFSAEVKKHGLFETFLGGRSEKPVSIRKDEMEDILRNAERVIKYIERNIEKLGKKLEENKKMLLSLKSEIEVLESLRGVDLDLGLLASLKKTFVVVGKVNAGVLPALKTQLSKFRIYLYSQGVENDESTTILLGLKTEEGEVRKLLVKYDFRFFELGVMKGKPSKILREKRKEMEWLEKKKDYLIRKRKDFICEWWEETKRIYLVLKAYKDRMKSLRMFQETKYVSVLEGWMPKKHEWKVQEALYTSTSGRVFFTFEEVEDAPTDLENPGFVKKFEIVTGGFGVPKYRDVDPTVFLALLFPIFFGFMLGDVVYGLLILTLSFLIKFYFKNKLSVIFSGILLLCGISAIFWGFLFGNFLGGFLGFQGIWFDPTQNPIMLIVISLVFGLVHVNMGIVLSLAQKLRRRESTTQEISWFLVEAGGLLIILRIFGMVADVLFYIGLLIFITGVGVKLAKPIESIGMLSFFGNILSYVRLAAISLATSYIALTVNHISSIFAGGSLILSGFIFTGGHLFNCAISSVGAFINSLRLHYVEFFSRFFEGGGKEFKPLKYEGIEVK